MMLLFSFMLCFGVEGIGWLLTAAAVKEWYPGVSKPSWTPPDRLFGPVWTLLFLLIALSGWAFCGRARGRPLRVGLALFLLQLVLNAIWSLLFFALRSPGAALAEIIVLWAAILANLLAFGRVSLAAGCFLLPYLIWVTYAAALNGAIWVLNT
jgi:tryptophan-rich sensory protein